MESFDLAKLICWSEDGFNIRGQRRINLVLLFEDGNELIVTNGFQKKEFAELYHHLEVKFSDFKDLLVPISHKPIYDSISNVLINDWNPLGIDSKEAQERYNDFVLVIFKLKASQSGREAIANELYRFETKVLGLHGNMNHCNRVALKIVGN
jgi:hypothetical protein